jgi:hypothetical protein
MKNVKTKNVLKVEKSKAPATVYSPNSILVIQTDPKVNVINAKRIRK